MRTYISPIGYDTRRVTRPVLDNGLDMGDEIVLLRPNTESDSRADNAIRDVRQMLEEVEPDISLTTKYITYDDATAALRECTNIIADAEGDVIVTPAGGARDVLSPFVLASLVHTTDIHLALTFSDIDGDVRELPLPNVVGEIPETVRPTLAGILASDDPLSLSTLSDETEQSKSTVTRHVKQLEESGFVTTTKDGKTKFVEVSLAGELVFRAGKST